MPSISSLTTKYTHPQAVLVKEIELTQYRNSKKLTDSITQLDGITLAVKDKEKDNQLTSY